MTEKNDGNILVTDIQRFSLHDGPGIRTTIFLKGCSVKCPWCSNPENISSKVQKYLKNGEIGQFGRFYTLDELFFEIIKDRVFYEYKENSNDQYERGGVTFSGGECLIQLSFAEPLLRKLREENIHIAVETSLFVSKKQLMTVVDSIDLFYVDIKILDRTKCKNIIGGDLEEFLENIYSLVKSRKKIVFRIPVIGGMTDDKENKSKVIQLIKELSQIECGNIIKIEIIKEHNLGLNKYSSLKACYSDVEIPQYNGVSDNVLVKYKIEIENEISIPVQICKV